MRTTRFAPALTAVVAAVVLALIGEPATAADLVFRDPAGDVQAAEFTSDGDIVYHPSATRNGDVVASKYRHTRHRVLVFLHYREIFLPEQLSAWSFRIAGSNHVARDVELMATRGHVGGRTMIVNRRGHRVHCDVSHRINYRTNSMWLSIPRSCLGNPRYVRIGNVSYWFHVDNDSATIYYDDPARVAGSITQVGGASRWIRSS